MSDETCGAEGSFDVLVIGGGQAGLAAAHALKNAGVSHLVVDALPSIGDSWRRRYDLLTLFTPRSMNSLPGMALEGDPEGYATKDEFADYLARYGAGHRIETGVRIVSLRREGDLFEAAAADGRRFAARAVIVATGAFQKPSIPSVSERFPSDVQQMHIGEFRNASSIKEGPVLVVGDGASGRDAAVALAAAHKVTLAQGRPRKLFPERIFGRSTWWWLRRLGLLRVHPGSLIGRRMRRIDPFPVRGNDNEALTRLGIELKPRLSGIEGRAAIHADGSRTLAKAVVWATGYGEDFRWIEIDGAVGQDGRAIHKEGASPAGGLYFVGRPWQRNRASALILGAGDDAHHVVEKIDCWLQSLPSSTAPGITATMCQ